MTVVLKGQKARPGENKRTPSFVFLTGSRVHVGFDFEGEISGRLKFQSPARGETKTD